ncbi:MAG TPA: TetR/AcrR family transcriptional regulator [Acidimicrobiales bacterium]|nr:TetR/AcrR family transcriptional regulator [Acidimicrobiales bacterium]
MSQTAPVPNRRGLRSRQLVLDAAERVMATEGFDATTVARVVEESGVPLSSVYHYYGSKDGILIAVMDRGAQRFFADVPEPDQRSGTAVDHLGLMVRTAVEALERHPDFLRLLVVFALQPPPGAARDVAKVVARVRGTARARLRTQIALAFGDDARAVVADRLARFALAAFDGAFIASRADSGVRLAVLLEPLPASLVAARRALLRD